MSLHVLDADHFSLAQKRHAEVCSRIEATPKDQLAISIITVEEQLSGWYTQIRKARTAEKLARAYQGLWDITEAVRAVNVVQFSPAAIRRYLDLRKSFPRHGRLDLAIAAIVMEADSVLLTRNRHDFASIPGLKLDDWTVPVL